MSSIEYWVALSLFRLLCQALIWRTTLFFSSYICSQLSEGIFFHSEILQTWKVLTALILGFPANLLLLLTGDVIPTHNDHVMKPSKVRGSANITHTRWHTHPSATSRHLLEILLPDLLYLANQNTAQGVTSSLVSLFLIILFPTDHFKESILQYQTNLLHQVLPHSSKA